MAVMKPTVGRRVWYWPGINNGGLNILDQAQPFDVGVAFVHGDNCINVAGNDHVGNPFRRLQVPLLQDGDVSRDREHCTWMPYQLNAAKKEAEAG